MPFFTFLLKPLSWSYGLILKFRHALYDRGFFYSEGFPQPVIKIGNLALGGTGKSPMTIYIAKYLLTKYPVYILSRGYKGKSLEPVEIMADSSSEIVGDEPLMIKLALPEARVVVCKDRLKGIRWINQNDSSFKVIILDDALQHRRLKNGFSILLTTFQNPFYQDDLIPLGKLRDIKDRVTLADIIVLTKSPSEIINEAIQVKIQTIHLWSKKKVIHSGIKYGNVLSLFNSNSEGIDSNVLAVSAIANADLFEIEVKRRTQLKKAFRYRDHYRFSENDVKEWIHFCLQNNIRQIITTAKDAVKLTSFKNSLLLYNIDILILPMEIAINENDEKRLIAGLMDYIKSFQGIG